MIQNRQTPRTYRIENAADASEATIYLYDVIDEYWGVSAGQFVKDLMAVKAEKIHLRINSPGGDVFAARAMATALRAHQSRVVAHVDGLAASAASYVALAADEVEIAAGAFFMIHRAWGVGVGTSEDMRELADLLDKVDGEIAADYVRETGNTAEAISVWMDAETWFTAEEAVSNGFADRLSEGAKAQAMWNLGAFDRAPQMDADIEKITESTDLADDAAHAAHALAELRLGTVEPSLKNR